MEIDRGRFLFLASAIAASTTTAGACATTGGPDASAPVAVPAQPSGTATSIEIPPMTMTTSPMPSASGVTSSAPEPAAMRSKGLWGFPPLDPPRTCAALKCPAGAPYDEMRPVVARECKALEVGLRPEVFQRAMACLTQSGPGGGPCDAPRFGDDPGQCLEGWSEPPQLDASTAAKCKTIVAACRGPGRSVHAGSGTLTMEQCQGVLSVTKPSVQARMIHCITEYCDGAPRLCWMSLQR